MWISLAQVLIIMLCLRLCPILICVLLIFLLNLPLVLLMSEMMALLGHGRIIFLFHCIILPSFTVSIVYIHLATSQVIYIPLCFQLSLDLSPLVSGTDTISFQSATSSIDWRSISPKDVDRYCQSVNVAFLSFHQNCFRAQKFLAMCTTMLSNSASLQCCILFLFFKEDGQLYRL